MRNLIFICIQFFLFGNVVNAQEFFSRSYGGEGDDYGRSVVECSTGGYLMVGSTNSFWDSSTDIYLLRVDELGDYIWGRNIGSENHIEWGVDIKESSDGSFYIAGITNNNGTNNYDGLLLKVDADGHEIWTKTYGGLDWDFIENMEITPDDEILLAGQKTVDGNQLGWLFKTDSEGEIIWEEEFEGTGMVKLTGVDLCPNGNIGITGFNDYQLLNQSTQISGVITADGGVEWLTSFPEFGDLTTQNCICSSLNKLVTVATVNTSNNTKHQYNSIYTETGEVDWSYFLNQETESEGGAVNELANGNILISLSMAGYGFAELDGITYVNSPNTGLVISSDYAGLFGGAGIDKLHGITPTSDGGFVSVGETSSFGENSQIFLVKIAETGESTFENEDFLDIATSIFKDEFEINVQLWPNPSKGKINLSVADQNNILWRYQILNSLGGVEIVGSLETINGNAQIDIATLDNGIYILRAFDDQQNQFSQKFVKID